MIGFFVLVHQADNPKDNGSTGDGYRGCSRYMEPIGCDCFFV
jgi:hypothetical protein